MSLDTGFVGRTYRAAAAYQVGREKIREFADAIGDDQLAYRDPAAARAAGYPDVIAPPTFAAVVSMRAQDAVISDPELGLDYSRVVHGDQSFTHHRPIHAGDELAATLHIDEIRSMGGNDVLTLRCEIANADGVAVTTARSTLVARGESE